jgi:hypothetical protein
LKAKDYKLSGSYAAGCRGKYLVLGRIPLHGDSALRRVLCGSQNVALRSSAENAKNLSSTDGEPSLNGIGDREHQRNSGFLNFSSSGATTGPNITFTELGLRMLKTTMLFFNNSVAQLT